VDSIQVDQNMTLWQFFCENRTESLDPYELDFLASRTTNALRKKPTPWNMNC
jgi:hypothetical protein